MRKEEDTRKFDAEEHGKKVVKFTPFIFHNLLIFFNNQLIIRYLSGVGATGGAAGSHHVAGDQDTDPPLKKVTRCSEPRLSSVFTYLHTSLHTPSALTLPYAERRN